MGGGGGGFLGGRYQYNLLKFENKAIKPSRFFIYGT